MPSVRGTRFPLCPNCRVPLIPRQFGQGDERASHGPVSLETGFTVPEKDSTEDMWDSVVRRVESELHRQGFKCKTTSVRGKKVRDRLLLTFFVVGSRRA